MDNEAAKEVDLMVKSMALSIRKLGPEQSRLLYLNSIMDTLENNVSKGSKGANTSQHMITEIVKLLYCQTEALAVCYIRLAQQSIKENNSGPIMVTE